MSHILDQFYKVIGVTNTFTDGKHTPLMQLSYARRRLNLLPVCNCVSQIPHRLVSDPVLDLTTINKEAV